MTLSPRQVVGGLALVSGAALVVAGLAWLFYQEARHVSRPDGSGGVHQRPHGGSAWRSFPASGADADANWIYMAALLLLLVAAAWLRLDGLVIKTLTHTEAIVPNMPFPPDITWPPPRRSFYDAFWWHFHGEGHPQAYYFFMWAWTHVFGTGLFIVRLPTVLFGIACVGLTYAIGTLTYDRRVGLLAAALLTFNGLHIYFSQYARLFMMGTFLSLLSTFLLVKAVRPGSRRLPWELAYVVVSWWAIYTQTFFWTVLFAQMVWVTWQHLSSRGLVQRMLALQALVVALGAPSLAHIIYRGDDVDLAGPSIGFIAQYIAFGWALQPDDLSIPPRAIPVGITAALAALGLLLAGLGLRVRERVARVPPDVRPLPIVRMLPVALGSALVVVGLTVVALRHHAAMAPVILLPFLALTAPALGAALHTSIQARRRDPTGARAGFAAPPLVVLLAIVPPLIVVALSFWTSMLIPRAFLIFVPYLLIVMAAGASLLFRRRALMAVLAGVLALIHTASILHYRDFPNDGIDYAGLGEQMRERIRTGDLVFVVPDSWFVTPIYYYLDDQGHTYVAGAYEEAVSRNPEARVWLLFFESVRWGPYGSTTDEMTAALTGFQTRDQVESRRARAVLYERDP